MRVISKKSTTRLVKGGEYEITQIWNDGDSKYMEGRCIIKDIGTFEVKDFIMTDGSPIGRMKIEVKREYFSDLKKGDIIVSNYDVGKSFVKDQMYVVEDTKSTTTPTEYGRMSTTNYIKFEGFPRWYIFNSWKFRQLTKEKAREISIDGILSSKKPPTITKRPKRSIDVLENKDEILIKVLSESICGKYRNNLGVVDWAVEKVGNKFGIQKKDFDHLMKMSLEDIIKIVD
jgi:hypothetical protein